ncbi:MAG: hypothetical protein HFH35_14985, partial [Eubacterium sp.]|nr:hypothetical protein [Eubacterium sp.]
MVKLEKVFHKGDFTMTRAEKRKMTDEFIKDECVKNPCTMLGVPEHEFLPHYVTV